MERRLIISLILLLLQPAFVSAEALLLEGTLSPGIYMSDGSIETRSTCTISSGVETKIKARGHIRFNPGFSVQPGGSITAIIRGENEFPVDWENYDITDALVLGGDLGSKLYASQGNVSTKNTCTVNSGTKTQIGSWLYVTLRPGLSVKSGGSLLIRNGDNDALPNDWEIDHFGDLKQRPAGDFDGDGLSNLAELKMGADPTDTDSDDDGVNDGIEKKLNSNPTSSTDHPSPGNYYDYDALGRIQSIIRIQ